MTNRGSVFYLASCLSNKAEKYLIYNYKAKMEPV